MSIAELCNTDHLWIGIGLFGQSLFAMRFIWQWLQSERQKRSVIPIGFWYFSIAGSIVILAYAIHKKDPVFILGQLPGVFIYSRNLYFIYREQRLKAAVDSI